MEEKNKETETGSEEEVTEALTNTKNRKAAGEDGIPPLSN